MEYKPQSVQDLAKTTVNMFHLYNDLLNKVQTNRESNQFYPAKER